MPPLTALLLAATYAYQAPAPCLTRPPADRTYTRARLLEIVKSQTPVRAEYLIRSCGVRVAIDSRLEADLREAGAATSVLAAIRAVAPKAALDEKAEAPVTNAPPPANGETRIHPKDGLRYVYIPPGTFRMGCSSDSCSSTEKPVHEVRITKGFWMGQTPVTVQAFRKFVRSTGRSMPDEPTLLDKRLNPNWNNESDPMVRASWFDAKDYCEAISMRLPTEAEWEYAARAGTTSLRYGELNEIAWWAGNSGDKPIDADGILKNDNANYASRIADNGNRPQPVAQKLANAFKLYDMLGNVWQWTSDWYKNSYDGEGLETDPQGPPGGEVRVMRGGSFFNESSVIRASYRSRTRPPGLHDSTVGFRCNGSALSP